MPDSKDYVVFWNGAHQGANQDLLFVDPLLKQAPLPAPAITRVYNAPGVRKGMQADSWAAAALRLLESTGEEFTSAEIAEQLGCSLDTVKAAIANLRDRSLVCIAQRGHRRVWGHRAWTYRAVSAKAASA